MRLATQGRRRVNDIDVEQALDLRGCHLEPMLTG